MAQQIPSQPSQPQKSYWTAGKIVALVLVAVLIVGVSGFAAFNYLNNRLNSPSGSSNSCSNGATNYPSCNICPPTQYYDTGQCKSGDFTMTATQPDSVPVGSSATSTISITAISGFTGTVVLSRAVPANYFPPGFTCSNVTPDSVTGSGTATVTCSSLVAVSLFMTVTGTSGSLSHNVGFSWNFFQNTCSKGATKLQS